MDPPSRPSKCPACNTDYKTIYYQRRAADEPPDKVTFCSDCPLDTTRLSIKDSIIKSSIHYTTKPVLNKRHSSNDLHKQQRTVFPTWSLEEKGYRICIRVEGSAALRCYKQIVKENKTMVPLTINTIPVEVGESKKLVQVRKTFPMHLEGHIVEKNMTIAPLVFMQQISIRIQKAIVNSYTVKFVAGYETLLNNIEYAEYTILRTLKGGKQPCILVYLPLQSIANNLTEEMYLNILQQILVTYGTEDTIKSFISSQMINTLFIQSGKAYDWPSAPDTGYVYAWKPDGERFWYIKYGSVWLFSRRLLSGHIAGWTIAESLSEAERVGPILDVEVMIGHLPIMIDLLVGDNGKPTLPSRSLDTVLEEIKYSKSINIPIYIREYYRSQQELLNTKDTLKYPVDGVVGIKDGSMTIIKLKDIKSIELKLKDSGDLVSAENIIVAQSQLHSIYPIDSIVEIRFTKQSDKDVPTITETLLRTDKTKANDYEVCENIMNTMSAIPETLARRNAVQWCSSVRQKINQIASKTTGKGRVILDIGAGDGQAISDYSTDSNITYMLVEPSKIKCQKLLRRLTEPGKGQSRLFESPEHFTKAIGLLSNKGLKYAVICAKIGDILKQEYSIRTLKGTVRYCIASFSISHTVSDLRDLALTGLDIIGCGYMYDMVDESGILIDEAGVKMKVIQNTVASVKWGGDKVYYERAIKLTDFKDLFHTRLAESLVPVFTGEEFSLLNTISSKVYIISTKKHI